MATTQPPSLTYRHDADPRRPSSSPALPVAPVRLSPATPEVSVRRRMGDDHQRARPPRRHVQSQQPRFRVESRQALVEDQQIGVLEQSPRQAHAARLALRQLPARLPDPLLQTRRETVEKVTEAEVPADPFCLAEVSQARRPPAAELALRRHYLMPGSCPGGTKPMGKLVAAVGGDRLDLADGGIAVNGRALLSTASLAVDSAGRSLPWQPEGERRVAAGEVWVLSSHRHSFDSRYFGPIGAAEVLGTLIPLVTAGGVDPSRLAGEIRRAHLNRSCPRQDQPQ